MITRKQHDKRAGQLYGLMRKRFAEKLWKSGRHAGTVRVPARELPFTRAAFIEWCWGGIGDMACVCRYCGAPYDIFTVTIDHRTPVSRDGSLDFENLEPICKDCNLAKGSMTADEYWQLLCFLNGKHSLREQVMKRLKDAGNAPRERFFRGKRKTT